MLSLLVARTRLLYYSPKEYENDHARAHLIVYRLLSSPMFGERSEKGTRRVKETNLTDVLNSGAVTGMQKFTEK